MADDEVRGEEPIDPTFATAGPRRSTFTPPPGAVDPLVHPSSGSASDDDDALADALRADFARASTGPIDFPRSGQQVPEVGEFDQPVPAPIAESTPDLVPPWASAPAPDRDDLVESGTRKPVRRSLDDGELLRRLDEAATEKGDTLSVIETLESQLRLREEEAREFSAWEATMLATGSPDAIAEVEAAREQFRGIVPLTSSIPIVTPTMPPPPAPVVPPVADSLVDRADESVVDEVAESSADDVAPVLISSFAPEATLPPIVPAPAVSPDAGAAFDAEQQPEPEPLPEPEPEPVLEPVLEPDAWPIAPAANLDGPLVDGPPALIEPPPLAAAIDGVIPPVPLSLDALSALEPSDDESSPILEIERTTPFPPDVDHSAVAPAFSFDDVLAGIPGDDRAVEQGATAEPSGVLHIDPVPVDDMPSAGPVTGSVPIVDLAIDEDVPDDVDETDRAFSADSPLLVDPTGAVVLPPSLTPPSGPIATVRVPDDEVVLIDNEPRRLPVFSLEESGLEPTAVENRIGRAARLFWLWFAANASVLSLSTGAVLFGLGMSLRQSIVAALAGIALSFLPLGLGTLAGKRSGQPTMVVSRATFGLIGNVVPAVLALVTRVFWGAALLWLLAISTSTLLTGAGLSGGLSEFQLTLIALGVGFVIALLIAFAGYSLISVIQLILTIVSGLLVVGLVVMTIQYVDVRTALSTPDGPWLLTLTGAVIVFSFVGLVWANSGSDLARYQRPGSSGAGSMLVAPIGATLPAFALIAYGAVLAASNPELAAGLTENPVTALAGLLPLWYPVPLLAATVLSLLSGVVITLYSGGFALQAVGIRVPRQWAIVIVGVILAGLAAALSLGMVPSADSLLLDVATTLAVPTAAWAGIFAAEVMIRNRRFETESLLRRGGVYPDVQWVNLVMLVVITAVGLGLTTATVGWLDWQGYLLPLIGIPLDTVLASTDFGVLVALGLGLLTPIVAGIPTIRRQEANEV